MKHKIIMNNIKQAHKVSVMQGYFDCPHCKRGYVKLPGNKNKTRCPECKGRPGIDRNKSLSEMLLFTISHLTKSFYYRESCLNGESHYVNEFVNFIHSGDRNLIWLKHTYENFMSRSHDGQIAAALLTIFDLCGYYNIKPDVSQFESGSGFDGSEEIEDAVFVLIRHVSAINLFNMEDFVYDISFIIASILNYCSSRKIDIQKHIEALIAYENILHKIDKRERN